MRVLIVEDDASFAQMVRRGLESEGFAVDVAADGEQGFLAAYEGDYDVIVLDIMLPRLNGFKVVEALRQRRVRTPVLMLSAKDGAYDQVDALEMGADDYLTKPCEFVVLVAHLRALARRAGPQADDAVRLGDLSLDPQSHRVARGSTEISLTVREFALLEYLIRRPERLLSKQQIVEAVWGADFTGDLNVVEVYVGYLRKKIDVPFGTRTIETVRGLGYRLTAATSAAAKSAAGADAGAGDVAAAAAVEG